MATLINGNGNPAIYAQQDADFYNGIMGPRTRILNVGSKMAATIEDANTIAIADGVIITKEGRRVQVDVGNVDEFIIPTGQAGATRYYIIGYHLYTDGSANQLCETFVQLMASGSETITEDEFREGATEVYVSLYRIEQTGLTLNDPEALLTVGDSVSQIEDDIDDIEGDIAQINSDLTDLSSYDLLIETHTTGWNQYNLSKHFSDYRFIKIDVGGSGGNVIGSNTIPCKLFKTVVSAAAAHGCYVYTSNATIFETYAYYIDDDTIAIYTNAASTYVHVYGIK